MTLLVDTSVVIKWLHEEGEGEVESSRALLAAHRRGTERLLVIDLLAYELGNILLRPLGQPAGAVSQQLDVVRRLVGPWVHPRPSWYEHAARLGEEHGLSFHDACCAASAAALDCLLVSADRRLLAAGLAVSPTRAATDMGG